MESSDLRTLLVAALLRPGYGGTTEEILSSCRLVGQAQGTFNPKELYDIREEVKMSEQVWKRMCSVSKNETLWQLRQDLPPTFSSLYRLNLLESYRVSSGVRDGTISDQSTTRDIDQIAKRERIDSRYKLSNRQVFFFSSGDLSEDDFTNLLEEVNIVAREYDCCFDSEDLEQIRKTDSRYQYDRRMMDIHYLLRQDIENLQVVESRYDDIEDDQEKEALMTLLIDMPFKEFVDNLMWISSSREKMMEEYGFLYCIKIVHEYWRTESRSQRYNYKRRLLEVKDKYPKLKEDVDYLYGKHIDV
jgi:hypothetical protein